MRHRIGSVRLRTTIGAAAIVLVALVVAGVALTSTLRRSQLDAVDNALDLRAVDIESLIDGGASLASVAVQSDEDGLVQVVDGDGDVVAASENIRGEPALVSGPTEVIVTRRVASLDGEAFRIHVHPTDGRARYTIVVGSTLENVDRNEDVLIGSLLIGIPVLLLLLAALTWIVVGRALQPVEAIRAQVAGIGGSELDRRVPVTGAHDEIGRLAVTMNAMLDRLEDSSRRQARFVSDASHELRTPIAVIRHELEVALGSAGGQSDQDWRAVAADVLEEGLRMQRLVDDLLFMARRDRPGPMGDATPPELVDLDDVVLEEIRRRPLDRIVDAHAVSAGQVRGRRDDLGRVVRNLLDNAARHASSRVAVGVVAAGGSVRLAVDDDGEGVDEDHRELVFERFGRGDQARSRDDGGSGLGLAIVREIVTAHGGSIAVEESSALGGACFVVTLRDARVAD